MAHSCPTCAAGRWLLHSGIRRSSGGFARFYDADATANRAVSTEITGYAASALVWLFRATEDSEYLDCAEDTASFLLNAWDQQLQTFPFEHPSPSSESEHLSYFFDCGIIIRGLLAVWHETHEDRLLETARSAAHGMIADFRAHRDYHPILSLPYKTAVGRNGQWSRGPGCYQLKAALAWRDVAEITGESTLKDAWDEMLASAIENHKTFLPGTTCEQKVMDRLHAFCYFLEGLLPELGNSQVACIYRDGIKTVSSYLQSIAPSFARSDVYAQLLRARLNAARIIPLDEGAAACEAAALATFQMESPDIRVDGGFIFGRRNGTDIMHLNPVSTVFGIQALQMWQDYQASGSKPLCLPLLI